MPIKKLTFILLSLAFHFAVLAQSQYQSKRCKWTKIQTDPFQIDSLSIEETTLRIQAIKPNNFLLKELDISYDINTNKIQFSSLNNHINLTKIDSVFLCYRVFPINFAAPYYGESYVAIDTSDYNEAYHKAEPKFIPKVIREELFITKGISKTGSLTRGISVGNAQNVFVNSALNLQLEGKLSDDISIIAAISDQNIPFQPEGNTQQLQDFDKVYIQLNHKKGNLTAGDILLNNTPNSYFLKFRKNVQGVKLHTTLGDSSSTYANTQIGVAVAKGQFYSQQLETQEGVLGPYRIYRSEIDKFIIVIANSEKVFLDGKQLQRGYNYDYVIDYNSAEITLTNNIVITKYSRVRINFEYASQNYSRSILQAHHKQKHGKLNFGITFYQEKDNKNKPLLATLNEKNISVLSAAGDQLENAVTLNVDTLSSYDPNKSIYTSVDTLVDGVIYSIFRRATVLDDLFLSVGFSNLGFGLGNYILTSRTTNGRVYQWVVPQNGQLQGTYEPVIQLPAPNKRQLISFRTSFDINDKEYFYTEMAFSTYDQNLFSNLDAFDNKGFATKVGYKNKERNFKLIDGYKWFAEASIEFVQKNFKMVDQFRSVDFDRNWSVNNQIPDEDIIISGSVGVRKNKENELTYKIAGRQRGINKGYQHQLSINKKIGVLKVKSNAFLMKNDQVNTISEWQKINVDISLPKDKIIPGYVYSTDRNKIFQAINDSIISSAMNFEQHKIYLQSGKQSKVKYKLDYFIRQDKTPLFGELEEENIAHTFSLSINKSHKQNNINVLFTYRKLENLRLLIDSQNEKTIMTRIDWKASFFNKLIRSSLNFNTASGRERKREFVYVQVATGLGTHTWRDDNKDEIQDLTEFYLAINPDEKNYAKFFVPTNKFIQAYSSSLNYRLNIQPSRDWQKKKSLKSFMGKFSNISAFILNMRTKENELLPRLLPFFYNISDDNLLANTTSIRSTFFYNKKNPNSGFQFQLLNLKNKQLLNNGFDAITELKYSMVFRINIKRIFNIKAKLNLGNKKSSSDIFKNRNFKLNETDINPIVTFQPNKNIRFSSSYFYKLKSNLSSNTNIESFGINKAQFNELELAVRLVKASKISAQLNFQISEIILKEDVSSQDINSPLGYEMLEALQPGINIRWKAILTQRLTNGLQLNFNYSGRKSQNQDVIHIGRMQVTALF